MRGVLLKVFVNLLYLLIHWGETAKKKLYKVDVEITKIT